MYRFSTRKIKHRRPLGLVKKILVVTAALFTGIILLLLLHAWIHDDTPHPEYDTPLENLTGTDDTASTEAVATETSFPEQSTFDGVIEQGDTAGVLLNEWLGFSDVQAIVNICADVFPLTKLRQGQPYTITSGMNGLETFEYEINNSQKLVVCRVDNAFTAKVEEIVYDVALIRVQGSIKNNLFQAVADAGENPNIAIDLADIFAWEINFIRDIREGDSFSLLVEKRHRNGEFKGYGKVLAAQFTNAGTNYDAYYFSGSQERGTHYTGSGESLKRAFLKAPLSFTRISSPYSPRRLHPILKVWRAHPGVDYAAPSGTPIKAIGSGTVTFAGWGKGAGNYIVLRHHGEYESMYLHLSRFAKGLKKGARVRQGEVIGYVGSTGYSTGPHLDFRMKKAGNFIDPIKSLSPRDEPLNKKNMPDFLRQKALFESWLANGIPSGNYNVETMGIE